MNQSRSNTPVGKQKRGVLLVNLGSPDSPEVPAVRRYLREFLMDGRVIDAPWPIRFGIVHFAILPKRPHQSAEAYRSIWTEQGSPLIQISRQVQAALQERTAVPVELAMRYQNPSIEEGINNMVDRGVNELLVIPLFPHYAMSSFETAAEKAKEVARELSPGMTVTVVPPYYAEPDYIEALVESSKPFLDPKCDHLLFSFHGLPERHLKKSDRSGCHCLKVENCCERESQAHLTCYRAQCFKTVREFLKKSDWAKENHSVAFQSRLGRDPWMQPYTDKEIERLAQSGVKNLAVICPAFVSDCLETLEEIGIRGSEMFRRAGGESLRLIPCLNDHPLWIDTLKGMVERFATKRDLVIAR